MTLDDIGDLGAAVMRTHGMGRSEALEAFCLSHRHLEPSAVFGFAALLGRCPWPSIDGNPPVDRNRPYLNLRRFPELDALMDEDDQL